MTLVDIFFENNDNFHGFMNRNIFQQFHDAVTVYPTLSRIFHRVHRSVNLWKSYILFNHKHFDSLQPPIISNYPTISTTPFLRFNC